MKYSLWLQALVKFLAGVILVGLLIFLPAGTLAYWNGWLLMGLLFIPMCIAGAVMLVKSPNLLKSRLNGKEKETEQKLVVLVSSALFLAGFILSGLTFRFGWMPLPTWTIIVASAAFLFGYGLYAEVLRENAYLSRTIGVQEGQKVVSTGLYGVVRHPMYLATIVMFLSIPLVLGSLIAFFVFLPYPLVLVFRIRNEEQVLEEQLDGYTEYQQRIKYRLIPFIW